MNVKQLQMLQNSTDTTERVDIKGIKLDMSLTAPERAKHYLTQIKNPYAFQCGNVRINVVFNSAGKTLTEAMTSYLSEGVTSK